MYRGENEETNSLLQPFLTDYVSYYTSPEVLLEINKLENGPSRIEQRAFVEQHFEPIRAYDQEIYHFVNAELLQYKGVDSTSNTGRDISHIAYAIACGADAFITRDNGWLNNQSSEHIFETYGLRILAPGELVKSIDEILYPDDYAPIQLAGLSLQYAEMTHEQFPAVVEALYHGYKDGKKSCFEQDLRNWMADPQTYHLELTQSNNDIASLIVCSTDGFNHTTTVHHILINPKVIKPSWARTFIKRVAFRVLEKAQAASSSSVEVKKQWLSNDAIKAFDESLFVNSESVLKKFIVSDIIKTNSLPNPSGFPQEYIISKLNELGDALNIRVIISLEKIFWPLKIDTASLPCYVVPIKAQYAMELFDQQLYHTNPCLFENERIEAALSPENVYFKNGKKLISKAPIQQTTCTKNIGDLEFCLKAKCASLVLDKSLL